MSMASSTKLIMFWVAIILILGIGVRGLSPHYYSSSCPEVFSTTKSVVEAAVKKEARMGASLLRLHFRDCFVHGCDGSILLDGEDGEKTAQPNYNSVREYEVVDEIKAAVEKECPGVVSCSDILAIAARDSTVLLGGPSWKVHLGRRDSTAAYKTTAEKVLPTPTSDLKTLISNFANQGLSVKDVVALSGAHTIGRARCSSFRERIYNNDTNIDSTFKAKLQGKCMGSNDTLAPLDAATPEHFDNRYFSNLLSEKGLLHSDQALTDSSYTLSHVKEYVKKPSKFFEDFTKSIVKMGNINPLTGSAGEIRINCRKVNN